MIYVGDNKFYVSEEENKRAIGCSKIEVHLDNVECANPKKEKTINVKSFSTRRIRRGLLSGKLSMYESNKEYIIKDNKGKTVLTFDKSLLDGKT